MDAEQVLAFRLARSGLAARTAGSLAAAAACPASDFQRDAALLALAARVEGISRDGYLRAVDAGELAVAHVVRGAIHALAPADLPLYGRALIATEDAELAAQLGRQVQRLAAEHGFAPTGALAEVAAAVDDALAHGRALGKDALHEELRRRVRGELLPWCQGCGSHHVAPMLWRYATVQAGVRLDAQRRYLHAAPGPAARASEAVRRFLRWYGPATPAEHADWAGVAKPHGRRLWDEVAGELDEVGSGRARAWLLREDARPSPRRPPPRACASCRPATPTSRSPTARCSPPTTRCASACSVPSPAPAWCCTTAGWPACGARRRRGTELTVEPLARLPRGELEDEAQRVARARGAAEATVLLS